MPHYSEEEIRNYLLAVETPPPERADWHTWTTWNLRRFRRTLEVVPPAESGDRCLEIGSIPYTFALLMKRFHQYSLAHVDFFAGGERQFRKIIRLPALGETHEFASELYDVEREDLPFPDESFAGVLCCEVLEHLTTDPVAMLAEIHRVLRPNGWLVLTTPNSGCLRNVVDLLHGRNIYRPYALAFGPTWRHNREYTAAEVRELLLGCGFEVEHLSVEDIAPNLEHRPFGHRALHWLLRLRYGLNYGEQIFVRARRRGQFCWHYPSWLFHHTEFYVSVRRPYVRVGENDAIQLGKGWLERESSDGVLVRRIGTAGATAYLRTRPGCSRLALELRQFDPEPRQLPLAVRPYQHASAKREWTGEIPLGGTGRQLASVVLPQPDETPAIEIEFLGGENSVGLSAIRWDR